MAESRGAPSVPGTRRDYRGTTPHLDGFAKRGDLAVELGFVRIAEIQGKTLAQAHYEADPPLFFWVEGEGPARLASDGPNDSTSLLDERCVQSPALSSRG